MKRREKLEKECKRLTDDKIAMENYLYMINGTIEEIREQLSNKSNEWLDEEVKE
jgi:hypothetical protein